MAPLWSSSDAVGWEACHARYDAVLQSLQKSDLAELDAWYLTSLPTLLRAREPEPHMEKQELQRLMEWKLKKGKWRPQLMKFITGLNEDEVKEASRDALQELKNGHLKAATEAFCVLKGVGPATASALLAAYDQSVPFMADEALEAIAGIIGPRKYTLPHFLSFAEQLRAKAQWLNDQRAAKDDGKAGATEVWTAQRVQLCLYAEAHDGAATASASSGKEEKKKKRAKTASPAAKRKAPPAADKQEKKLEEDRDQPLRRSHRKRQRPAA